ncbi:OB-fold domain-containing protein [Aquibacillus koreensis]|uniref:OB-fold domain-containing protein n=1 Tax=Aquibacillus koreensis TaxID=279446 RepID=A0A9X4ALI6_9BACI|nr:OB-fold domain-containing protein [Aquibacillus koreensis]MCT2535348.1 OB-fold domain-containing protein [Aquibacillus koreensis]MDC3422513.1 OB-fold domain-containing protein [Aquibacillus koreensis]
MDGDIFREQMIHNSPNGASLESLRQLSVPGPTVTTVTKPFWDGVARGEFLLQWCTACKKWVFYPRTHCQHCWSDQLNWKEASGLATLQTWSTVHKPGHPAWQEIAPYVVAVVQLEEGPTMMTQLLIDQRNKDQLQAGIALQIQYVQCGDHVLPFFAIV